MPLTTEDAAQLVADFVRDAQRSAAAAEQAAAAARQAAWETAHAGKQFTDRKMDLVRVLQERDLLHELPVKGAADQVWLELMAKYQV